MYSFTFRKKQRSALAALGLSCVMLFATIPVPVCADDEISTDAQVLSYQDQLAALQEKQAQATEELQQLHNEQANVWAEKLKIDELINITTQQKQLAEKQIESINKQIDEKIKSIEDTTARIEAQQTAFYERMVDSYTEKKTDYLELVLGAESLVDFLTKFDYVANIMEDDRKIIAKLESDKETLASDQAILEEALERQVSLVADLEEAINSRQLLNNSLENYFDSLNADIAYSESIKRENLLQQAEVQDNLTQRIQQVQAEQQQKIEAERQRILEEQERQRQAEIAAEQERQRQAAIAEEQERQRQAAIAEEEERQRQEALAAEEQRRLEAEEEQRRREEEWERQQAAEEEQYWSDWSEEEDSWENDWEEDTWKDDGSSWTIDLSHTEDEEEYSSGSSSVNWAGNGMTGTGYDGDTSSTWETGGKWQGDGYETDDSWTKVSYSDSYKQYYVEGGYVGGSASWVLEYGTPYTVSSEFGGRELYGVYDFHLGIDLACAAGTIIHAYNAGTVLISEYHYSYGNYVLIDHGGGLQTLYAHMSERAVSAGDWVESGEIVGYVGMTGSAYGYHLHFEVRENGEVQNPRNYFNFEI